MAHTKQMERKTNTGLPKATMGTKGGGDGSGGAVGGSDRNRNAKGKVPSGHFSQQLENRPPAAAPKCKKPYVCALQEMRKLQRTTKLCISKYQMAR